MSEYQYYEFAAIDKPLTSEQIDELRGLSSRAEISATRFVNVYNWGDFRGDPYRLMKSHFDAFLYLTNWGTRRLMFRLPAPALPAEVAVPFACPDTFSVSRAGEFILVDYHLEEEPGEWVSGEGWLAGLNLKKERGCSPCRHGTPTISRK